MLNINNLIYQHFNPNFNIFRNLSYLLASIISSEVISSLVERNRLPTNQWVLMDITNKSATNENLAQNLTKNRKMSVMIIGEGILAQILSNSMSQTSLSSIAITSKAHEEFKQNSNVKDLNLVVSCGGSFEQRR